MSEARVCRACRRPNPQDARFCSACGSPLTIEAPHREARKVVTAFFADVVGSTALGERLDPEDLQEVVGEAVARMVRTVEEFGGHVDRVAGDGVVVLFGAPVAHEDDPQRAILAALRMLDVIAEYAADLSQRLRIEGFAVRVGIETGTAVLAPVGGARPIEFGAMGDVLNTAARLEAAAEAGTVLVGPHTFRLAESAFEWGETVELRLKGKAGVVVAHRPRRPRAPAGRRHADQSQTPLVGRERELEAIGAALDQLVSGAGGVLLIRGEPGLGKTRLLSELRRRVQASSGANGPPLWLEGRCVSYGERLAYLPFQVLLRDWLGVAPEQSERDVAASLRGRLVELFGDRSDDLRPFLGSVLGLVPSPAQAGRLAGLQPEDVRLRAFDAVKELVARLARDRPVALALEDLHWADATSVALAEHLVALAAEVPVLLVLATRPERNHDSWRACERVLRDFGPLTQAIELTALGRERDRELLTALVGGTELPLEFEQRVLQRADGNPLYLEELVRSLIDAGALVRDDDGGLRFEREVEVEVPETVEKLVLARADLLSPAARELLCAASVIGRRFTRALLEAVAGDASTLGELGQARLVLEGPHQLGQEYRFKHHLIQEATYGSVLKRRRQELHRRTAEAIEAGLAGRVEEQLGVLAHHWDSAGDLDRAIDCHTRAGIAVWQVAPGEAREHHLAALDAAARLGLDERDAREGRILFELGRLNSDRAAGESEFWRALAAARASGDRALEMDVLSTGAGYRMGGYQQALGLGEEALAIARSLGDKRAEVFALSRLGLLDSNRLRLDVALQRGRQAVKLARELGDVEVVGWALDGLKLAELKLGQLDAVERDCDELIAIHRSWGTLYWLCWAKLESSFALLGHGRLEEALTRADEAYAINRQIGDQINEPMFLDGLSWIHRARGDYAEALRLGRRGNALAAERSHLEWVGWTAATLAWALLDLRAADEAARVLEAGIDAARADGATGEVLRCTAQLAWARWLRGEHAAALELAGEAEAMLAEVTAPPGSAWLFGAHAPLAVARVRLASGEPRWAGALTRALLKAAERTGWQQVVADAAVVAGACEEAGGRRAAAVRRYEKALVAATAAGYPAPAWEAHIALARLRADTKGKHHAMEARDLLERTLANLGEDPAARAMGAELLPAAAGR